MKELLITYPQFKSCDEEELEYLLIFRNMIYLSVNLFKDLSQMKGILLQAGSLFENSGNQYITGSGANPSTTRRIDIYQSESGITPKKCPKRTLKPRQEKYVRKIRRGGKIYRCTGKIITKRSIEDLIEERKDMIKITIPTIVDDEPKIEEIAEPPHYNFRPKKPKVESYDSTDVESEISDLTNDYTQEVFDFDFLNLDFTVDLLPDTFEFEDFEELSEYDISVLMDN